MEWQEGEGSDPLRCPRCDSLDTKFRYYNNHSLSQPRYYCRTCKRQWTAGGTLRDVPVGGRSRNRPQPPPDPIQSFPSEAPNMYPGYLVPMPGPEPQAFTGIQPVGDIPTASYQHNDEISCLDAIQYLILSDVIDKSLLDNNGTQQVGNVDPRPETIVPDVPLQDHVHDSVPYGDVVQPTMSMDPLPQDPVNNLNPFPDTWWNQSDGDGSSMEMDPTSIDPNQWNNFPNYGPP